MPQEWVEPDYEDIFTDDIFTFSAINWEVKGPDKERLFKTFLKVFRIAYKAIKEERTQHCYFDFPIFREDAILARLRFSINSDLWISFERDTLTKTSIPASYVQPINTEALETLINLLKNKFLIPLNNAIDESFYHHALSIFDPNLIGQHIYRL